MITNEDAYNRLEAASEDALEGANAARSPAARDRLIELSRTFDAELSRMIERDLRASAERYAPLTSELTDRKGEIEDVAKRAGALVAGADLAAKLGASFARVGALL